MSDARTLLRAARAERRIQHPAAQYTASGKLLCRYCEINVKDDKKAWNTHLSSTQHTLRQSQADDAARSKKKRKVDEVDEENVESEERKRPRGVHEDVHNSPETDQGRGQEEPQVKIEAQQSNDIKQEADPSIVTTNQEAEFAALLDEFARGEDQQPPASQGLSSTAATISAAPVSAEELAAQARGEESTQKRGRRDEEIEAEREDAAERLQDEFEEMESLEARVKKLKEWRERLKRESASSDKNASQTAPAVRSEQSQVLEAVEEESSDESEVDDWRFGGS